VVHLLATQAEFTSFASASAVAGRAGVDAATVVRTARALGFSGWPDLRLELRNRYLSSLRANEVLNEHEGAASDPILHALRSDVDNVTLAIRTIDVAQVRAIAAAIAGARRTVVIASGSFLGPAHHLVHSAGFMGLDVEFGIRGGTTLVNTLTRLGPGDCLVAINFWRLPREIRDATEIAGVAGATTCVLTDLRRSALTELADHVVTVPCEGTSHFPSLTASMAVVHAILAEITRTLGDQARDAMRATEDLWQRMNLMCD
jgi:DNA-binding MurR/RpiR family transcriptional regulator